MIADKLALSWGDFAYLRARNGTRPLVLIHPLATGAGLWAPYVPEFGARDTIAIDLRGCGNSGWDGKPYAIADLADDLAALLDALNIGRVDLAGMSMGGCVAIQFAATRPHRVGNLALCDTTAWYGEQAQANWEERAQGVEQKPREALLAFQTQRWFNDQFRETHTQDVQRVVDLFVRNSGHAHAAACRSLGAFDARPIIGDITANTISLTGEEDYATPSAMGEAVAAAIPGARFKLWPGVRHFAVVESPELRAFIADHLNR